MRHVTIPGLGLVFVLAGCSGGPAPTVAPPATSEKPAAPIPEPVSARVPVPVPPATPSVVWSDARESPATATTGPIRGYFKAQPLTVTRSGLPSHTAVRVRFKLVIKGGWDGNNAVWGPDLLGCRVRGGEQLFLTSFSNIGANSPYYTQSFPDDFPTANHYAFTGATPLSGEPFKTPEPAYEAEIADSVYDFDITFPHSGDVLTLDFAPLFTDPDSDNQFWGVSGFSCEAAPDPTPLSAEENESLWDDLAADDSPKAVAAMWRFVAAGGTAEAFLMEKSKALPLRGADEDAQWNKPTGLRIMRLERALRLIGSRRSVAESNRLTYRVIPDHETSGGSISN